jgi:hypothetical protein
MHAAQRLATILLLAAPAGAGVPASRLSEGSAYVRAVLTITGTARSVTATDAAPADGRASLALRARAAAAPPAADGVRVSVRRTPRGLTVTTIAAARRFKYLAYRVLQRPQRLVLELWKSSPPPPAARWLQGRGGCLTLERIAAPPGQITAGGREHGLFEHAFGLVLRRSDGRIGARRTVVAAGGRWSAHLAYSEPQRQAGTLEAVARSPKDGALACLAQARVVLATSEAAP